MTKRKTDPEFDGACLQFVARLEQLSRCLDPKNYDGNRYVLHSSAVAHIGQLLFQAVHAGFFGRDPLLLSFISEDDADAENESGRMLVFAMRVFRKWLPVVDEAFAQLPLPAEVHFVEGTCPVENPRQSIIEFSEWIREALCALVRRLRSQLVPPPLSCVQKACLEALKGRALTKIELARLALRTEHSRRYLDRPGGLGELIQWGRVQLCGRKYFRPDFPPPDLNG